MSSPNEPQERLESASPATSPEEAVRSRSPSSQPLANVNAARRPPVAAASNPDIVARMRAFHLSRQNTPAGAGAGPGPAGRAPSTRPLSPDSASSPRPAAFQLPPHLQRPAFQPVNSAPAVTGGNALRGPGKGLSLAEKRGMKLAGGLPGPAQPPPPPPVSASGSNTAAPGAPAGRRKPGLKLSDIGVGQGPTANSLSTCKQGEKAKEQTAMEKYSRFIDTRNGALTFKGKATVTGEGIEFASGKSFHISLDEVDILDELGKGNYGTVYKVRHARPKFRRAGQGLAGNKPLRVADKAHEEEVGAISPSQAGKAGTTGVVMAIKEMRLELDEAKFQSIIMELDVLHRCVSPYIIDFYGAFFQEGAVYICIEWMDGGSMDKLYGDGVPENVLRKVTLATTLGLKSLKEEHNIIHRDVKPTNILVNTKGQVKICDFGVSGNLVASIARTNIGCQSYMAPERISSGGMASAGAAGGTYSVQSDIWSLGLTIIECAMGRYPYPPETYDNIFSQLSAIVEGDPPDLPADKFSEAAIDFVAGCLNKVPKLRPTYPMLLQHAWLAPLVKPETIQEEDEEAAEAGGDLPNGGIDGQAVEGGNGSVDEEVGRWVIEALDKRKRGVLGNAQKPALHAAPLDQIGSPKAESQKTAPVAVDV